MWTKLPESVGSKRLSIRIFLYLFVFFVFVYQEISILCAKILCVTWALEFTNSLGGQINKCQLFFFRTPSCDVTSLTFRRKKKKLLQSKSHVLLVFRYSSKLWLGIVRKWRHVPRVSMILWPQFEFCNSFKCDWRWDWEWIINRVTLFTDYVFFSFTISLCFLTFFHTGQ